MPGSRSRIGPDGVKGQRPLGETEFSHFYTPQKLASPGQKLVKIRRLERINKEEI